MDSTEIIAAINAITSKLHSSTHSMAIDGTPIFIKSFIPTTLNEALFGMCHASLSFSSPLRCPVYTVISMNYRKLLMEITKGGP